MKNMKTKVGFNVGTMCHIGLLVTAGLMTGLLVRHAVPPAHATSCLMIYNDGFILKRSQVDSQKAVSENPTIPWPECARLVTYEMTVYHVISLGRMSGKHDTDDKINVNLLFGADGDPRSVE